MDYEKEEKKKLLRKKRQKKNLIFNIMFITLLVMTLITIVMMVSYHKQKNTSKEVMSQKLELEQKLNDGTYISKYESDKRIENAKNDILENIKTMMENGTTTLTLMENLYPNQIVAADKGRYHFFAINENLAKNPYTFDTLNYPVLNEEEDRYEGDVSCKDKQVATRKGIDVSKFQGEINWYKVKNDGIKFAYIRLGYRGYESGKVVLDERYEENIEGANKARIDTGVYFFTEAVNEREAWEEADFVLENIEGYQIDLPIVIDVEESASEDSRTKDLTKEERTKIVKAFYNRIKESGHEAMIYGNTKSFMIMMDINELEGYDKWFAYYKYPLRFPYKMKIWQYTAKGKVDGIKGGTDINIEFY